MFKHDAKEFKKIIDEVQTEKEKFLECQYMRESGMRTGKNNKQSRDTQRTTTYIMQITETGKKFSTLFLIN